MRHIRQKFFILNYLGSLLIITATFVPIIKFNNQAFAFIDQFFYLSFAIVILSTITLILATMKKFKLSLIPTILNMIIIIYGIYSILSIDGMSIIKTNEESGFNYGIAFWLYPIGIILNILGGLLSTNHNVKKKEKEKKIQPLLQENNNLEIKEPNDIPEETVINLDYNEQIPLSNILNKNISTDIQQTEVINVDSNNKSIDNSEFLSNELEQENKEQILNKNQNEIIDDVSLKKDDNEISNKVQNISILQEDDTLLEEIEEYQYSDDEFFEEIAEDEIIENHDDTINIPNIDEEILMDDIPDNQDINKPNISHNIDVEIPDIDLTSEDLMTNNTQIIDEPKPEFMALNPSDIKVDTKKTFFKKKEKKEEDPLERIMKRNIPTTLGRTCQFCNTPLGDDERICPICGRIN